TYILPCPNKKSNSELKVNFHSRHLFEIAKGIMKDNESIITENKELKAVCKAQAETIEKLIELSNYQHEVKAKLHSDLDKAFSISKNQEFFC
ncbi:hypothetical protein ABFV55_27545, partial [Pseudomonas syringae]|uniref:hypothetical protein n=1 Tax=Pseudomonas syringae TaxID=317 RepID=UPI0034D9669F